MFSFAKHLGVSLLILGPYFVTCCTDILLNTTTNGTVVSARSMDFDVDVYHSLKVYPRGTLIKEPPALECPTCVPYEWKNKYGFVAITPNGRDLTALDGLNEKGLSSANLHLTGTIYPKLDPSDKKPIITGLNSYILGNFATVQEVKEGLKHIQYGEIDSRSPMRLPFHFSIHDALGYNLVVEFIEGEMKMYDSPLGVVTNAPSFEWQITNLEHYKGEPIASDFGGASRFRRAVSMNGMNRFDYAVNASFGTPNVEQANVADALHMISYFNVPKGLSGSFTHYQLVRDHINLKYYIVSTQNMVPRVIDLNNIDFDNTEGTNNLIPVSFGWWAIDITASLQEKNMDLANLKSPSLQVFNHALNNTYWVVKNATAAFNRR